MQIGIVGAGNIGRTLARLCAAAGHEVILSNSRGAASLADTAAALGVRAGDPIDAARAADLVVFALRPTVFPRLDPALFAALSPDAIVVDTGNYYPEARDGRIAAIDAGMPESAWVAQIVGRPVLKAFNTIGAASLATRGRPRSSDERVALAVAGDDTAAKQRLIALIDAIGFDAVDTGGLAESWRQQPGTLAYCHDLPVPILRAALAAASPERIDHCRAEGDAFAIQLIAMHTDAGRV